MTTSDVRNELIKKQILYSENLTVLSLSESQINDLSRPLARAVEAFYADEENERKYQEWLLSVKEQKE